MCSTQDYAVRDPDREESRTGRAKLRSPGRPRVRMKEGGATSGEAPTGRRGGKRAAATGGEAPTDRANALAVVSHWLTPTKAQLMAKHWRW